MFDTFFYYSRGAHLKNFKKVILTSYNGLRAHYSDIIRTYYYYIIIILCTLLQMYTTF